MKTSIIMRFAATAMLAAMTIPGIAQTVGPNGESATPSKDIVVSDQQAGDLKAKKLKAALLWHEQSDFVNAVTAGATDEFKRAGIEIVATTSAGFDSAKQLADVETTLALKPDIILALPLDPVASAAAFKKASEAGVKLVFLSNLPKDYKHPADYGAIVTDDLFQMGKHAADALAASMNKTGKVGYIFHDAAYYVTNQRDKAFKTTVEKDYPDMKIVAEAGISDPARAQEIASAMLVQNPDLGGIYVTWAGPAEGVLAALRGAGNKTTKVVTLDLSEPIALDMVKDGNIAAIVADEAYELGRAMAAVGERAVLGVENPPFIVAPVLTVSKDNVKEGYMQSLHRDVPASVMNK
jgi:ribose transport system substrate-binding protein